jgi:hypothetical protein
MGHPLEAPTAPKKKVELKTLVSIEMEKKLAAKLFKEVVALNQRKD